MCLVAALLFSCSPRDSTPKSTSDDLILARVRVVDLEGRPLEGMVPIATNRPNAFDSPVAKGYPTDSSGRSWVALDPDRWLCVRAWDPELRFFANKYFEIPPGPGTITEELELVMVEGATLCMQVFDPDGRPLAGEEVAIMMAHPEHGPWWPDKASADGDGAVTFDRVPAGTYFLKIGTARSGEIELSEVILPPAGRADLGKVQLH